MFVSIGQRIGCEDHLQNDLDCVGWGFKLYSNNKTVNCHNFCTVWSCFLLILANWFRLLCGGTVAAAPLPFRLDDPALWEPSPSHPIVSPIVLL